VLVGILVGVLLASSCTPTATVTNPSKHLVEIQSEDQYGTVLKGNRVVLVDFYADWCGPCRQLKPTIHKLADAYAGRVAVVGVNVDQFSSLAEKHGIEGIPDVRVFKQGEQIHQWVGLQGWDAYARALDGTLE